MAFSVMGIWIWLMDHCEIESMYLFFILFLLSYISENQQVFSF